MPDRYRPESRKEFKQFPETFKFEIKIDEEFPFDDVAKCTIYKHADLKYEQDCKEAINRIKNKIGLMKDWSMDDFLKLDWKGLYNQRFLDILDEEDIESQIDKYGSFGWTDKGGNLHFGDSSGFFPFYSDEKTLRKDLKESKVAP